MGRLQQAIDQKRLEDAKLFWFAALAMLRAIGHVLDKVDAKAQGANFRNKLDERFRLWKQDPIFINFIELERNNILKEYESSLSELAATEDGFLLLESGDSLLTESGDNFVITTTITNLVKGHGMFSGMAPPDVLSKALTWWDKELSELEQISE